MKDLSKGKPHTSLSNGLPFALHQTAGITPASIKYEYPVNHRSRPIHIPLFDAHCDTVSAMLKSKGGGGSGGVGGGDLYSNNLHVDLLRAEVFGVYAQFFAIFGLIVPQGDGNFAESLTWSSGEACFEDQYRTFLREMEKYENKIEFCTSAKDAERAALRGRSAAFLSVEGAEILDCSIERLEKAYNQGVRAVVLTWNFENKLSGSNDEGSDKGLTDLGRRFVRKCEELGIIVDVSHISRKGFWDVIEIAQRPVIASHSNSMALCDNKRNLSDRQFRAIADTGGVAGINLFSDFLGENPDIDTVTAHIERFLQLGGEKNIAIGADFDGCDKLPEGIDGIDSVYRIAENLLKKNYTETLVYDIFYNNLLRVVMEICDT